MITTHTTATVTAEKKELLTKALGEAITLLPGKSEAYLMLDFIGECQKAFHGDTSLPLAFVEVKLLGRSTKAAYEALTARICDVFEKILDIPANGTYVKYEEVEHWGYNRFHFYKITNLFLEFLHSL